jgi:tetratricopeptide (TPR) repeat protein
MVLRWSGVATDPAALAPQVYTPGRGGTLQHDLVGGARRSGRLAIELRALDALLAELAAGHPVLVMQNLGLPWWPQWHYAVATGYDLEAGRLRLHSGTTARHELSLAAFDHTWQGAERWALLVLPPDQLPASADDGTVLRAASDLERVGQDDAAALAYGAALERWPRSLAALIGWGNSRYAAGDLPAARQAFRNAVTLYPEAGPAWNNLAQVLAELGEIDAARTAIGRALALGGPDAASYQATRAEIDARAR